MARRTEEEMIAYALEVDVGLLAHMPELLADLESLGSDPEDLVDALQRAKLPADALVYDLGCGKGANAVAVAHQLGVRVVGFDLFDPFIEHCRRRAAEAGIDDRCTFERANIVELPGRWAAADAVLLAALGDVIGPLDETMATLRQLVKPGGVVVIADSYLKPQASADFRRFEGYAGRDETIRRLEANGDTVEHELTQDDDEETTSSFAHELRMMKQRAQAIAAREPALTASLKTFIDEQTAEYSYLAESTIDVVWVIRRA